MRFKGIKWWKEKRQREDRLRELYRKRLTLFGVWHDMLCPVKKMIIITGSELQEVSEKVATAIAPLYELSSFDKRDAYYPGEVKRLHSLTSGPFVEMNQQEEDNVMKVIATISYTQNELMPGVTEEAFYAAVDAFDKAAEEHTQYCKECSAFGMKDVF